MVDPYLKPHSRIVQRNPEELAKTYPGWFRKLEWVGMVFFFTLFLFLCYKIFLVVSALWFLLLPAFFCGWVIADFACGFVHWAADTWGSPDIPILGSALIRPFREHHADPLAMTKHDFIETNAACSLIGLPLLLICLFIPMGPKNPFLSFTFFLIFFLTTFGLFTNQIHKWSHSKNTFWLIKFLQDKHLILNPTHHQIHHTAPYNKHYCITTGWLNHFLHSINFFPYCEKLITKYTGALPRQDDIGEIAAREIAEHNGKAS